MNIKDIINKIFKKNNNSFDLVNLSSLLINIPSKDKLTEEELKILDNYKNEYKAILKQRKHLVSNDLDTNNLLNKEKTNYTTEIKETPKKKQKVLKFE